MEFRLATFNLFNLVRPSIRYYELPPHSEEEYEQKLTWIARTLERTHADIVGFQEVFSSESLKAAVSQAQNFSEHAHVISPGAEREKNEKDGKALRPKVGLATRFQILRYESIIHFPNTVDFKIPIKEPDGIERLIEIPINKFERPPLRAEILIPEVDLTVIVYVAHLKSKRPIYRENEQREDAFHRSLGSMRAQIIRSLEATALRTRILEDIKENKQPLVLLGDLNDVVKSVSTQIVAGESPDSRWPSKIKRMYWDVLLYSTNTIQTSQDLKDFGYTHIHHGHRDVLDHILVSQEFYHRNPKRIGKVTYQQIFNDHLFDWSLTAREPDRIMSDHGIPVAEIELDKI